MLVLLTNSGTLGTFLFSLPNLPKPNLCYPYGAMFSKPLEGGRAPSAPAPARGPNVGRHLGHSDQILVKSSCGCFFNFTLCNFLFLFSALKVQRRHDVFKDNQLVVYDGGKNAYAPRPINIASGNWFEARLLLHYLDLWTFICPVFGNLFRFIGS